MLTAQAKYPQFVIRNLFIWANDYITSGVAASVNRNNHMNAFGSNLGDLLPSMCDSGGFVQNVPHNSKNKNKIFGFKDDAKARLLLFDLLSQVDLTGVPNENGKVFRRIVDTLVANLDYFHELGAVDKLDKDTVEAIMVDFINYAAMRVGMDYGLYTGCLRTHKIS